MTRQIKISQSLLKALSEYIQGIECGISFKVRYITKEVEFTPTKTMKLGNFFEFHATGAMPRSGEPQAEKTQKGEYTEDYKRALASAQYFKGLLNHFDIKILEKNFLLEGEKEKGYLDILAEWDGRVVIIDLKYSGLLDDKWSPYGWHNDFLSEKENIMIQPVSYKGLAREVLGVENMPFFFWVFDSKKPLYAKIIEVEVDEQRFYSHKEAVDIAINYLQTHIEKDDWIPRPELLRCQSCAYKSKCPHGVDYPIIEKVYF